MATLSPTVPPLREALRACLVSLRRIAEYKIDPVLDRLLLDLGERKEFLGPAEKEVLLALVDFTQQRSLEKLESELALRHLVAACPVLAADP